VHWATGPLLRSADDPGAFLELLSIASVDELLQHRGPRLPAVRLVKDGSPIPSSRFTRSGRIGSQDVHDLLDPARVAAEFAAGATISLQGLQRYWPPLGDLCASLESALTLPFQANAYLSPAGATGLRVHHDTHDVFVLQVEGSKHFDVYEPAVVLPVAGQHWVSDDPPGDPVISADLKPGDCLYMPRGWRHRAFTTDSHSLHLTIGALAYTWLGLVTEISSALAADLRFRSPLPAGFAHDPDALTAEVADRIAALQSWLGTADPAQLAARLTQRYVRGRPAPSSSLAALAQRATIAHDTPLRRRRFVRAFLRSAGERVELLLADRRVSFPASARPVLVAILDAGTCSAQSLPGDLDDDSRLVVVRRLVDEGLLEPA
jgi:mannose-6-phosphate isomerase-like protein (cupin superfamily)